MRRFTYRRKEGGEYPNLLRRHVVRRIFLLEIERARILALLPASEGGEKP